ncbi:MAG: hypothetical protein JW751_05240 [Polyangiaceae bacterium]|nr:hypothetical protein [Polyangiaceae bacterium]
MSALWILALAAVGSACGGTTTKDDGPTSSGHAGETNGLHAETSGGSGVGGVGGAGAPVPPSTTFVIADYDEDALSIDDPTPSEAECRQPADAYRSSDAEVCLLEPLACEAELAAFVDCTRAAARRSAPQQQTVHRVLEAGGGFRTLPAQL